MLETGVYESADGKLAALLATFYEAAGAPATWAPALCSVMASSHAKVGLIVSHDFESGLSRIEHAENLSDEMIAAYVRQGASANPLLRQEALFRDADRVVVGDQILPQETLTESAFYQDWLRPAGLHHSLWGVLARKGKRMVCAAFGRSEGSPPFAANDIALITQVLPHFRRIMQLRELVGTSSVSQHILMEMLGALSVGVALLDGECRVVDANAMAAGWLKKEHDITLQGKNPCATHNGLKANLQSLLKSAHTNGDERKMSVMRSEGAEPVTLILVPLRAQNHIFEQDRSASILVISDPEYRCRIREDQLVKFYDFTPTEAKLARLLSNGYRLDQAADAMGIRYQTARTHLKRVFSKTGIDRQSELVRLILTGPASFRLPESAAEGWLDMHFDEFGTVHSRLHAEPPDR